MRIWLRSVVDAILGKVPGKTRGADIATRMAMDADFTDRRHPSTPIRWPWQERDDAHLTKPAGALADVGVLEELIRIVNDAQARDAEDERRLYGPPIPQRGSRFDDRGNNPARDGPPKHWAILRVGPQRAYCGSLLACG